MFFQMRSWDELWYVRSMERERGNWVHWLVIVIGVFGGVFFWLWAFPPIGTRQVSVMEPLPAETPVVSVERQIRAIERRDPRKEAEENCARHDLFFYAVAEDKVHVPGAPEHIITPPLKFPVKVISGTRFAAGDPRVQHLNRIAQEYAKVHNEIMYGFMMTW